MIECIELIVAGSCCDVSRWERVCVMKEREECDERKTVKRNE